VGEPYFTPGTPLVLDTASARKAAVGDLAVVRRQAGRGRTTLERVVGPSSAIENVLEALLHGEGLRRPFEPFEPSREGDGARVDLTGLTTFTIDPETAQDFDDAISVRSDGDGIRAWVHIADVAAYVRAGSPLDRGASRRSFSTYVPGRVAPMLPPELADDACSLRPHVERACVTVELPLGARLERGEPNFYRSLILSRERLTYGRAEGVLAGRETAEPDVAEGLRLAERLTEGLRRQRFARGALRIESPELAFAFDGEGGVEDAWKESEPHAHALVEELMILANEAVARLLAARRREALYRVHERPEPQSINLLLSRLAELGVPTPPAPDEETLSPSEAAAVAAAAADEVMRYVRRSGRGGEAFPALVLRSLKQARYDPRNLGHSGLASPAYCHFTSPIRRYPDLVCHRALLRELGASDEPLPDDLAELAEHASAREREAARLEYRADEICLAWLLDRRLFELGWDHGWDGEIVGVIPSGLFVRFGEVFEGYVPARWLPGDYFELDALATALVGRRTGRRFRLGDGIRVRVEDIRRAEGEVELRLA
jgi:ribonuclease R